MSDVKYEYGCEITSTSECPLRKEIRADAFDEFISTIKPRMKWDNDVYTLAIEHCIEVAELLKEQNGKC